MPVSAVLSAYDQCCVKLKFLEKRRTKEAAEACLDVVLTANRLLTTTMQSLNNVRFDRDDGWISITPDQVDEALEMLFPGSETDYTQLPNLQVKINNLLALLRSRLNRTRPK